MAELAAAATVEAMSVEDVGVEDAELKDIVSPCPQPTRRWLLSRSPSRLDKENEGDLPVVGDARAADPKVVVEMEKPRSHPHAAGTAPDTPQTP